MNKHTPSPWTIRESPTHVTVVGSDNETIFHDDKRLPHVIEDARLIAASPDLLEALKVLVDNGGIGPEEMFDIARAAIVKATGGNQ